MNPPTMAELERKMKMKAVTITLVTMCAAVYTALYFAMSYPGVVLP